MVKRSRLEIYFIILEVIQSGVDKPTRIMYASNLSWDHLSESLGTLIIKGFIRKEGMGRMKKYYITEKGTRALRYHQQSLEELIKVML